MRTYAVSVPGDVVVCPDFGDALRNHDLRNIEYSDGVAPHPAITAQAVKNLTKLHNEGVLQIKSLHLPFYPFTVWQYAADDEAARQEAIRLTLEYMEHFAHLDIHELTIHCGGEPNLPEERERRMAQMVRTCHDLQPVLERWNASLNLELLPRSCIGNHEDELLYMVDQLPAEYFNLCIDVNHLMDRWREIPAVIRKCASRIRSFHISDYDGIDECHWQVGHGIIPWCEVSAEIKALTQDVLVIIEVTPLKVAGDKRWVDSEVRLTSAEQNCIRLEFADEWEHLHRKLWS